MWVVNTVEFGRGRAEVAGGVQRAHGEHVVALGGERDRRGLAVDDALGDAVLEQQVADQAARRWRRPPARTSVAEVSVTRSAEISAGPSGGVWVVVRRSGGVRALSRWSASTAATAIG